LFASIFDVFALLYFFSIYYVLGNHEYLHGSNGIEWLTHMASIGINSMNNTRSTLPPPSSAPFGTCTETELIDLLGVGEISEGATKVDKAVQGRDEDKVAVLLAHQPSVSDEAKKYAIDLQVSGHVHGG
jgi:predicted MPP superfamily phosphohydrolase